MIFADIDKLTDTEARKDEMFKRTIGHGVLPGTPSVELFQACHRFRSVYKQPAIFDLSNNRATTDNLYVPDKGKWDAAQNYAIDQLKARYDFVEVTDEEATQLRVEALNAISRGDAVNKVLHLKLAEKLVQGSYLPDILDAAYCAVRETTLYFFAMECK
jgi:hypothetical protein